MSDIHLYIRFVSLIFHNRLHKTSWGGGRLMLISLEPHLIDCALPLSGRVPDAKGGGLGRHQPDDQRSETSSGSSGAVPRHLAFLPPAVLQGPTGKPFPKRFCLFFFVAHIRTRVRNGWKLEARPGWDDRTCEIWQGNEILASSTFSITRTGKSYRK